MLFLRATLSELLATYEWYDAKIHLWNVIFGITTYWTIAYFVFFVIAGLTDFFGRFKNGWKIALIGLILCFVLFFVAAGRATYWAEAKNVWWKKQ